MVNDLLFAALVAVLFLAAFPFLAKFCAWFSGEWMRAFEDLYHQFFSCKP